MTDSQLLTAYTADGSQDAFSQLVNRYVNLVYSAALRRTRDPHVADDVTQAVFIVLARKAGKIRTAAVLPAWLLNTTRYAASNAVRMQSRRRAHEQQAASMKTETAPASDAIPISDDNFTSALDDAMAKLKSTDRSALALRYFQSMSVREVAAQLDLSEVATQKRLGRALQQLRRNLQNRGIETPAAALETNLVGAISIAPAALSDLITAHVAAAPGTASAASLIANATVKSLWIAKTKLLASVCAAVLVTMGAAAVLKFDIGLLTSTENPVLAQSPASAPQIAAPTITNTTSSPPLRPSTQSGSQDLPNLTFIINRNPQNFQNGLDPKTPGAGGTSTMLLQSDTDLGETFGTALRGIDPTPYVGKRIRFSCQVKADNLANWAGLAFFAQGPDGTVLAHDDSGGRPIIRSTDWREMDVVADVPRDAAVMMFGLKLHGAGKIWLDSAKLEVVGNDVPITDDRAWHSWSFSAPRYTQMLDDSVQRNGHPTIRLSSTSARKGDYCDYERTEYDVEKFRGKAIRMTAWIKTEDASAASGLALRCRGKDWRNLGADVGDKERAIKGTSGWKQYELIASVPPETDMIRYGVRLAGKGKLWVDDVRCEVFDLATLSPAAPAP